MAIQGDAKLVAEQILSRLSSDAGNAGRSDRIEVVLNQELGDPFRRDAMTTPVVVADISANDMRPQSSAS